MHKKRLRSLKNGNGAYCIVNPPSNGGGFCYVKIFWTCANRTKSFGNLPCPKRSTGTFWRGSLLGSVKRGSVRGRSPSKCFRISHPLLRFFEIKGISLSADSDKGAYCFSKTMPP